jgi:hypothetical protein
MAGAEGIDANAPEVADDRSADIVGGLNAGPEAADAAHHHVDLHARPARIVERADDHGIDQRIAFDQMAAGGWPWRLISSAIKQQARLQRQRRHRDGVRAHLLGMPVMKWKMRATSARHGWIGGEERQVGGKPVPSP